MTDGGVIMASGRSLQDTSFANVCLHTEISTKDQGLKFVSNIHLVSVTGLIIMPLCRYHAYFAAILGPPLSVVGLAFSVLLALCAKGMHSASF